MNQNLILKFKKKIEQGYVIGPFMKTCDPAFVESAGYAGMDFVILDMEHGPAGIETMQNNIRAAQISGLFTVVRVPSISEEAIGKALDIGAAGVQVPQVSSANEAERAVSMAKFYPQGERGVCRFVRAANYSSLPRNEYFTSANENFVIVQLEGAKAIENLDSILSVQGIDIVFIGPYDLSQSFGVPGEITHPLVLAEMEKIVKTARSKGVVVGVFADTPKAAQIWKGLGVQYIAYSVDVGIFSEACLQIKSQL